MTYKLQFFLFQAENARYLPGKYIITTLSVISSFLSAFETVSRSGWEEQERQEGEEGGRGTGEVSRGCLTLH